MTSNVRASSWLSGTAEVCICGIGARTPLGLDAPSAAAAVRAAISAVTADTDLVDQSGENICVARDAQVPPDVGIVDRMATLLASALHEALGGVFPRNAGESLQCLIGLPATRPGLPIGLDQAISTALAEYLGGSPGTIGVLPYGHAAGLMAFQIAAQRIAQEETGLCIVAGVDSYLSAQTLEWLDTTGRLMSGDNRSGFPPGEGAGTCLLASRRAADQYALPVLGVISAAATAIEPHPDRSGAVCLGEGLSAAILSATQHLRLPRERVTATYCDLNGERYRSEEFTYALLQTQEAFVNAHDYLCPADCWGDMGAASGPLLACLAITADRRGYSKGPRPLLWAGSESGYRSAVLLAFQDG